MTIKGGLCLSKETKSIWLEGEKSVLHHWKERRNCCQSQGGEKIKKNISPSKSALPSLWQRCSKKKKKKKKPYRDMELLWSGWDSKRTEHQCTKHCIHTETPPSPSARLFMQSHCKLTDSTRNLNTLRENVVSRKWCQYYYRQPHFSPKCTDNSYDYTKAKIRYE